MAFNRKKVKKLVFSLFTRAVDMLVSFVSLSLYIFVIFGAMCSFMLLAYLYPDKTAILSKPFLLVLQIIWNLIKITFIVAMSILTAYLFFVFYDLLEKASKKREERRKKFILDIAKEIKTREKKK